MNLLSAAREEILGTVYSYKGAIHIHSRYSDGSGGFKQIAKAALKAALDFIIITDHNTLRLQRQGREGWYENQLLVIVGEEVSHSNQHLLAIGNNEEIPANLKPEQSSAAILKNGGFGVVAHPDGTYRFDFRQHDYSWRNWEIDTIQAIEVWSYMFDWVRSVKPWNLLYYFLHPERAISGPTSQTLQIWDRLNRRRRVTGIGAIDAHARGLWPVQIFPYRQLFNTVVTYVLLPASLSAETEIAKKQLLHQMRAGRCYFAYEKSQKAKGFRFWLETPTCILEMGDRAMYQPNTQLHVGFPTRCSFRVIKSGEVIFKGVGQSWNMKLHRPGVYRIEAFSQNQPWIFSNPIVVTDGENE